MKLRKTLISMLSTVFGVAVAFSVCLSLGVQNKVFALDDISNITALDKTFNISLLNGDNSGYITEYDMAFTSKKTETITSISIGGQKVFTGAKELTANVEETITLDMSNAQTFFGKQEMYIETNLSNYICVANVATKVLTTKEDVQGWLDVAIALQSAHGGKVSGYYLLGNNITSDSYWNYQPKAGMTAPFKQDSFTGFKGTFDGNGYYIEKMNINNNTERVRTGFIPAIEEGGVVKNVAFVDAKFTADVKDSNINGFITAGLAGTISDVYVDMVFTTNINPQTVDGFGIISSAKAATSRVERVFVYGRLENLTCAGGKFNACFGANAGTVANVFGVHDKNYKKPKL